MLVFQLFIYSFLAYWFTVLCYMFPWGKRNTNEIPDDCTRVCTVVLKNQCLYTGVYVLPFLYYPQETYSVAHGLWQLPSIIVLTDVLFFIAHYTMHTKWLYKRVHSTHHEYHVPIAAGALYAHPVEHIFVNLFSVVTPIFLVKVHPTIAVWWTILASMNTVVSHSTAQKDDTHGLHHRYRNCNYGVGFMLLDRLFGTYIQR